MKGEKKNLEKILVWMVPGLFAAVFLLIFFMWLRIDEEVSAVERRQASENQAAVTETEMADMQTEEVREDVPGDLAKEWLNGMTLEEKAAQLLVITPEALTGVDVAEVAGESTAAAFHTYPVGGIVYFEQNLVSEEQLSELLSNMQQIGQERLGFPVFLSVDEEGGRVARVANQGGFPVTNPGPMGTIGESQDTQAAYQAAAGIGSYLSTYGFNLNYAPVADVVDNPENQVIGDRSFGSEPEQVAEMAESAVEGFASQKILTVLKHFPGHGTTTEDSHVGLAYNYKTLEELQSCEFLPFQSGIQAGAQFVMVGHISLPNVTQTEEPATFSSLVVEELLRKELGFQGVVITDAMNMGAVAENYTSAEAAVKALEAGCDMLLMPYDFVAAYQGILDAVDQGILTEERINESVLRILKVKEKLVK